MFVKIVNIFFVTILKKNINKYNYNKISIYLLAKL